MTEDRARELLTRERRRVERSLAIASGEREGEDELSTVDQLERAAAGSTRRRA